MIRAISDLHGSLPEIEPCDILLIAGDVCPDYMRWTYTSESRFLNGEQKQAKWLERKFKPWLESLPAKHIVGIAGNHDFVFERPFLVPVLPWTYLQNTETTVEGLRIYGYPYVPNLPAWAFPGDDPSVIPEGIDILLSHGPPDGMGDRASGALGGINHAGSLPLRDRIKEVQPKVVICGHIHEGRGVYDKEGFPPVYNVAHMTIKYEPTGKEVEISEFS